MHILITVTTIALLVGAGCPPSGSGNGASGSDSGATGTTDAGSSQETGQAEEDGFTLKSSAFRDGNELPQEYTADGENSSPPLTFEDVPHDAREVALMMVDPDAPAEGGYTHWLLWSLAPKIPGIPGELPATEEVDRIGGIQGTNSAGEIGYTGPAPPEGDAAHSYEFTAYALAEEIDLQPGATREELESAMEGNILAETTLTATYGR
jgi:Raf kinase inhibitor-like YbhB/YbcL family protein